MRAREHVGANRIRRKAGREGQACAYCARRFVSSRARNLLGFIQREPAALFFSLHPKLFKPGFLNQVQGFCGIGSRGEVCRESIVAPERSEQGSDQSPDRI